jgi:raffinose synthase
VQLSCERFVALARAKLYWCVPSWGTAAADLPVETQMLLLDLGAGWHALLMPLIDSAEFRSSLRPPRWAAPRSAAGRLILRMESGDESVRGNAFDPALLIAAGRDPYEVIERGVGAATRLSGAGRPRAEKEAPASLDVFGWCTWWVQIFESPGEGCFFVSEFCIYLSCTAL